MDDAGQNSLRIAIVNVYNSLGPLVGFRWDGRLSDSIGELLAEAPCFGDKCAVLYVAQRAIPHIFLEMSMH